MSKADPTHPIREPVPLRVVTTDGTAIQLFNQHSPAPIPPAMRIHAGSALPYDLEDLALYALHHRYDQPWADIPKTPMGRYVDYLGACGIDPLATLLLWQVQGVNVSFAGIDPEEEDQDD